MKFLKNQWSWLFMGVLVCAVTLVGLGSSAASRVLAQEGGIGPSALNVPGNSSPIAFANNVVWVVNPDDDSISLIDANSDTLVKKVFVGDEPQSIALALDNTFDINAYVANAADNTVTVVKFNGNANNAVAITTLTTGAEPWNVVARPDGAFVYVANSGQDTITVIRASDRTPVSTFNLGSSACNVGDTNRHFQPRGLAITGNGGFLFVTRFLSFTKAGGVQGDDNGKEGIVCRLTINGGSGALSNPVAISLPAQDTGFNATIGGVDTPTSAYPNQLQSIVICGNGIANEQAYLPNIASSPDAPLKFNVDTHAFVNRISNLGGAPPTSAGALNLHLGARDPEPGKIKLFFANPWAIACNNPINPTTAYAASAGSDLLVKLNVSGGVLNFTVDANTTRYIDLNDPNNPATSGANAGKNPLGIVVNDLGTKAYVMNFVSRNVSVVNLATDSVLKVIQTTPLPPPGSQEEQLQVGAEMFFSSRGVFNGGKVNRLSSEGWQNCASCHFAGLTDGTVWIFGAGPRKSVPLNGSFSPHNPDDQRVLNYSAIFDEVQDFEANIRNVSGPGALAGGAQDPNHGLLIGDNGDINGAPGAVNAFALPNAGRPQLTVTLPGSGTAWPALDALNEWVRFAIRTPNGALTDVELSDAGASTVGGIPVSDVTPGRRLFFQARCQICHGGTKWTVSNKDFTSPPAGNEIFTENPPVAAAVGTQFLNRFLSNINSFNLGVLGQGNLINGNVGAIEKANKANATSENGFDALGRDHSGDGNGNGFNIPALLGIWQVPPYYHNGSCETLACVLSNQQHRTARGTLPDVVNTAGEQADVVAFLKTLDADTEFPLNLYIDRHDIFLDPPTVFQGTNVDIGANISLFGTEADLANLISDLGAGSLTVNFTLTTTAGSSSQTVQLAAADFNQDFGQATKSVTFSVPGNAGRLATVRVEVDSDGELPETKESDNVATRSVLIFPPPPDRTPPVVNNVFISDDNPFNDNDQIATTQNVQVKIVAVDPPSPSPQPTSGLKSFCLVRYAYDVVQRRWVEETCVFQALPAPVGPNTFIVNTRLRPREGVGYVFAWVKDNEGNISRTPGFDFISFIPGNPINLNRNDIRLFRINTASPLQFTFTPSFGDIDVSVFQGFSSSAPRCALSANNGSQPETVTIGSGPCTGTEFQIEVRAIVNSRFTISVAAGASLATMAGDIGISAVGNTPLVGGPPALRTAIGDDQEIFLPLIVK
jgi:DNA-binding beta-propeller fold protein YncE